MEFLFVSDFTNIVENQRKIQTLLKTICVRPKTKLNSAFTNCSVWFSPGGPTGPLCLLNLRMMEREAICMLRADLYASIASSTVKNLMKAYLTNKTI